VCIFSVVHWLYCPSFNLRLLISTLASSNINYMWKSFSNNLQFVCGFLRVFLFSPPIKLTTTI
jgi:hypothetical protein